MRVPPATAVFFGTAVVVSFLLWKVTPPVKSSVSSPKVFDRPMSGLADQHDATCIPGSMAAADFEKADGSASS